RAFELLHLAQPDADAEPVALGDHRVRRARTGRECPRDEIAREVDELAHARVPPTVRPSIRMVGIPTPTGTDWPSLPQVPIPSSSCMSLPTRVIRVSTSGPLPMSVAPRTGRVT